MWADVAVHQNSTSIFYVTGGQILRFVGFRLYNIRNPASILCYMWSDIAVHQNSTLIFYVTGGLMLRFVGVRLYNKSLHPFLYHTWAGAAVHLY